MKRALPVLGSAAVVAAVLALWLARCSGPRPHVRDVIAHAPAAGQPWVVEAVVENDGLGDGEAAVTARLKDPKSGETWQNDATADLRRGESTHIEVPVRAPARDGLVPDVDVSYPAR